MNQLTLEQRLRVTARFDAAVTLVHAIDQLNIAGYVGLNTDQHRKQVRAAEDVWDLLKHRGAA